MDSDGNGNGGFFSGSDGRGDDAGNGDGYCGPGTALLRGMELDDELENLLYPYTPEAIALASNLQTSSTQEEYESILAILELRKDK